MPQHINTRMRFTVEQKVFALGAWLKTESIAQACHMFENEYGFKLPRSILASWIHVYRFKERDKSTSGIEMRIHTEKYQ